jgi:nucleoside-diphosphate kinase
MADTQRTVILIKPDAMQRDLLGEIIGRFERKGLKIIGLKFIQLTDALLEEHYSHHKEKPFFASLKTFMKQTPVAAMVLEGLDAVAESRKLIGATDPLKADAGTIRADLSMNMPSNLVHASDSTETAKEELKRFFKKDELFAYEKITDRYVFGEGI